MSNPTSLAQRRHQAILCNEVLEEEWWDAVNKALRQKMMDHIRNDVMASFVDPEAAPLEEIEARTDAAIEALNDEAVGSVAVRRACEALKAEQPEIFVCRLFHVPPKFGIVE